MNNDEVENFRDSIATIDKEGKRNFIHPKKPKGRYTNYRNYVSWFLLAILFGSPFVKINGNQFLLFNIIDRKFNIFGQPFWPQDFYLLVLSLLVSVVFIILFTVIFGRIFCGWMCPQTIFMEMVFRKIEYWIEGDRTKQIKLDKQAWNAEKIGKKIIKWTLFAIVSFMIANAFLAYFIGGDVLIQHIQDGPVAHVDTFVKLLVFTSVFYFVFAWFREQVCIIACPYGRLQSVLLDNKSIVVAYDHKRGESRQKLRKNEDREEKEYGDCIDCKQCVLVCPTGIDIRNGTQLECVNCTACIDACDSIMDTVGFDRGLIRYASENNIVKGEKFEYNSRIISYIVVLTLLFTFFVTLLFLRNDVQANFLHLPGQLYSTEGEQVSNVYTFKIINKTNNPYQDVKIKLLSHDGAMEVVGGQVNIPEGGLYEGTVFVKIDKDKLSASKEKIKIGIYSKGELIEETHTNFSSPLQIK
ncbi:cytochrome c oxidase accessory protein CcoG [Lutimonas halocynthiae]|uniref:cytochrome c oxidase accessory protein CcoG n=1 Tax=Lutimonas halocynthiae TaxID=1446477 RepID=UPI0025B5072D|nr:cytochrome c oxidase accessory protein CcoG [Lutimonas halocynthiae]MDN3644243.1 cytochrome c oxidase accessory protein CcoG [Lutimonas halocynthiae]